MNSSSFHNKASLVHDWIVEERAKLVYIRKTWLGSDGVIPSLKSDQLITSMAPAVTPGKGGGMAIIIQEFLVMLTGTARQINWVWDRSWEQMLLHVLPCNRVACLLELFHIVSFGRVELPRPMALRDFKLLALDLRSKAFQELLINHGNYVFNSVYWEPSNFQKCKCRETVKGKAITGIWVAYKSNNYHHHPDPPIAVIISHFHKNNFISW